MILIQYYIVRNEQYKHTINSKTYYYIRSTYKSEDEAQYSRVQNSYVLQRNMQLYNHVLRCSISKLIRQYVISQYILENTSGFYRWSIFPTYGDFVTALIQIYTLFVFYLFHCSTCKHPLFLILHLYKDSTICMELFLLFHFVIYFHDISATLLFL